MRTESNVSGIDRLVTALDRGLRVLSGVDRASRAYPAPPTSPGVRASDANSAQALPPEDRRIAGSLMRVNHVGEVCAQALYTAQALTTRSAELRRRFEQAARDETDHLAWTGQRLRELGARPSFLNPVWYAGAFGLGLLAGRANDATSLGFVVETERQVEQHLESHLDRLPAGDHVSRAIVQQMKEDEAGHAAAAEQAGATRLPAPIRWAMRAAAKVMTTTAHHV